MRLPVRFFDTKMIGDLRQRIDDNTRIQSFLTTNLVNTSFGIFMFVIYSLVIGMVQLEDTSGLPVGKHPVRRLDIPVHEKKKGTG